MTIFYKHIWLKQTNSSIPSTHDDALGCSEGFCDDIVGYSPEGISAPLSLFLLSSLPVGFLLFFLWKSGQNYKKAWRTSTRYSVNFDDGSSMSTRRKPFTPITKQVTKNPIYCCGRPNVTKKQHVPLFPFYYSFIQFVSLLFSLNFILRGFFSNFFFVDRILTPILFAVMEFSQVYVIGFMFMTNMNAKNKLVAGAIAGLVSLGDIGLRFILEYQDIPVLNLSCKRLFAEYWIVYNSFYMIVYTILLILRKTRLKFLVRPAIIPYVSILLIIAIINLTSSIFLYLGYDSGLCIWILGQFLFYIVYTPVLYYALRRDSVFWYFYLQQKLEDSERQPLLPTDELAHEFIIDWDDLSLIKSIGRGGHGEVFLGKHKNKSVAVKKLLFQSLTDKDASEFKLEMKILSKLNHPNIVKMLGACVYLPNMAIVTEYMPMGSLQDVLYDDTIELSYKIRLKIARDTARGVAYLHSLTPCIIHRDLKSSNLLVGQHFETKVGDFGIARFKEERTMTMVGTVQWSAPEVLKGLRYSESSDVYSFGIILWELVVRKQPHENMTNYEIITGVVQNDLRPPIPDDFPIGYTELMVKLWDPEPDNRPTFDVILDTLERMMVDAEIDEWLS